jgi:hypothetical protein
LGLSDLAGASSQGAVARQNIERAQGNNQFAYLSALEIISR